MPNNYTKEELDTAKQELETMSPEELLSLRTELEALKSASALPEAPAVVFIDQGLRGPSGMIIKLTARGMDLKEALDLLAEGINYGREKYELQPVGNPVNTQDISKDNEVSKTISSTSSSEKATSSTAEQQADTQEIVVESLTREKTRSGNKDWLRTKGGFLRKFGVPAYMEVVPTSLDINKMQIGVEYNNIPVDMRVAVVTTEKPYKVLSFHA